MYHTKTRPSVFTLQILVLFIMFFCFFHLFGVFGGSRYINYWKLLFIYIYIYIYNQYEHVFAAACKCVCVCVCVHTPNISAGNGMAIFNRWMLSKWQMFHGHVWILLILSWAPWNIDSLWYPQDTPIVSQLYSHQMVMIIVLPYGFVWK